MTINRFTPAPAKSLCGDLAQQIAQFRSPAPRRTLRRTAAGASIQRSSAARVAGDPRLGDV